MNAQELSGRLTGWLAEGRGRWRPPETSELARAVSDLSRLYTRQRDALTREVPGRAHLMARLHFFLPRDLGKVTHALESLAKEELVPQPRKPRVLDLGAGLGASALGAMAYYEGVPGVEELKIEAWDTDAVALEAMGHVVDNAPSLGLPPVSLATHTGSLVRLPELGRFDLILMGLVLNELAEDVEARARLLARLSTRLAPGGILLVIEPALRSSSRALMAVRDRLASSAGAPHILGPCLHAAPCPLLPRARDWCHAELRTELDPALAKVAAEAGLRRSRLTYSWLALGNAACRAQSRGARIVSGPLRSKGKLELDVCHHGGVTRVMRLERQRNDRNRALDELGRGDRIWLHGGEWTPGRLRLLPGMSIEARDRGDDEEP